MNKFQALAAELVDMIFNHLSAADMAALRQSSKALRQLVNEGAPRQSRIARMVSDSNIQELHEHLSTAGYCAAPDSTLLSSLRHWVNLHGIDEDTHLDFALMYERHNHMRWPEEQRDSSHLPYHQHLSTLVFYLLWADYNLHGSEASKRLYAKDNPTQEMWEPAAAYWETSDWHNLLPDWRQDCQRSAEAYRQAHSPALANVEINHTNVHRQWCFHELDKQGKLYGMAHSEWMAMETDLETNPLYGAPVHLKYNALQELGFGYEDEEEWVTHRSLEKALGLRYLDGRFQYFPRRLSTMGLMKRWVAQPEGEKDEVLKLQILEDIRVIYVGYVDNVPISPWL